jgi:hypothetical protein
MEVQPEYTIDSSSVIEMKLRPLMEGDEAVTPPPPPVGSTVEIWWASGGESYRGTVINTRADGGVVKYNDGDISWETFGKGCSLVDGPETEGGDRGEVFWEDGLVSRSDRSPSLADDMTLWAGRKVGFWSGQYGAGDPRGQVHTRVASITISGNPGETCPLPHVEFEVPEDLENDRGVMTYGPEGRSNAMVPLEQYRMMHSAVSIQEPDALATIAQRARAQILAAARAAGFEGVARGHKGAADEHHGSTSAEQVA